MEREGEVMVVVVVVGWGIAGGVDEEKRSQTEKKKKKRVQEGTKREGGMNFGKQKRAHVGKGKSKKR